MRLSLVIPCYNESRNLARLLARLRQVFRDSDKVEVLLVNNGSTDDSADVLARELVKPEYAFVRTVTVPTNLGYGHGIMSGLRAARGEILAWTHADLQTDPEDVLAGMELLTQDPKPEHCLVRGRRHGRPWFDAVFSLGMAAIASLALRAKLRDINAQPKLFHRHFLGCLRNPPDDFSLDLYVLYVARQQGMKIVEFPVFFGTRAAGVAKGGGTLVGKLRLVARTLRFIGALRRRILQTVGETEDAALISG